MLHFHVMTAAEPLAFFRLFKRRCGVAAVRRCGGAAVRRCGGAALRRCGDGRILTHLRYKLNGGRCFFRQASAEVIAIQQIK